jgi:hypothetical protein
MSLTVHTVLSIANWSGGLLGLPETAYAGILYDENDDLIWDWLGNSAYSNWSDDLIYHWFVEKDVWRID